MFMTPLQLGRFSKTRCLRSIAFLSRSYPSSSSSSSSSTANSRLGSFHISKIKPSPLSSQARTMSGKTAVSTTAAAAPAGPYSQGIKAGPYIFVSGQIPVTPSGELVTKSIEAATEQCLQNLEAILTAGGSSLSNVVKTTIYLTDMNDFAAVNEVYGKFFEQAEGPKPARACIAAKALPKNVPVEIDCIALA